MYAKDELDLRHCQDYFQSLYNAPPHAPPVTPLARPPTQPPINDTFPSPEEVRQAISALRNTAPGLDGVRAEGLKKALDAADVDNDLITHLCAIMALAWETGTVPSEWTRTRLVAIPKFSGAVALDDHRGLSMLSVASKILTKIIHHRISSVQIDARQFGFRPGVGTADATLNLRIILSEARRVGLPLTVTFVDLIKAYDSVPRSLLFETAELYGMGPKAVQIVKALYEDKVHVSLGGHCSESGFSTSIGVRQGCLLSPVLFTWIFDRIIRSCAPELTGIALIDQSDTPWRMDLLAYADDVAIISPSRHHAQHDIRVFAAACKSAGLRISTKKTKVLHLPDKRPPPPPTSEPPQPPLQTTPDGAIWLAVNNRKTQLTCPQCLTALCNDVALRLHMKDQHGLVVNILSSPPTTIEVPNISPIANSPYWQCECGQSLSSQSAAGAHWRRKQCHNSTGTIRWVASNGKPLEKNTDPRAAYATQLHNLQLDTPAHEDEHITLPGPEGTPTPTILQPVEAFPYLGSIIDKSGHDTQAIKTRMKIAAMSLASLLPKCRGASKYTKLLFWRAVVKAQLTFATETFTLLQSDKDMLDTFQQQWLRRITGILPYLDPTTGRVHFPPTRAVLAAAGEPPLSRQVDAQRLRLYGHVRRFPQDALCQRLLNSHIPMRPRPGVHQNSWKVQLANLVSEAGMNLLSPLDRGSWRGGISRWLSQYNALEVDSTQPT